MAANEARERGNALYRHGKLAEAAKAYKEAAKLAPDDPAPFSNLSAVHFELGQCAIAAEYAQKALLLTGEGAQAKMQTLLTRLAKCYLFSLQIDKAVEVSKRLDASLNGNDSLLGSIQTTAEVWAKSQGRPISSFWGRLLDRIPQRKVSLLDTSEYFPFGHDIPKPLFDPSSMTNVTSSPQISYLFCGSGDGRHVFWQLVTTSLAIVQHGRKIHITMIDLKAPAMARMIVMFELLLLYSTAYAMYRSDKDAGQWYVLMLSYVFAGTVVPPEVDEKLRDIIAGVAKALEENPETPIHSSIYVQPNAIPDIIRHLKSWSQSSEGSHPASAVRAAGMRRTGTTKFETDQISSGKKKSFATWLDDCKVFNQFGIVLPPRRFMVKIEPGLDKVISSYLANPKSPNAIKAVDDYLDANWKANTTLFDMDWEAARQKTTEYLGPDLPIYPQLVCDAPYMAATLQGEDPGKFNPKGKSVSEWVQEFFLCIGQCMPGIITGKATIEMIVGEMSDFMDRLAHDALPHRQTNAPNVDGQDPSEFPKVYDFVHLSNIPDYAGGHLTAFLDTYPILRDNASNFRFTVLLNPSHFLTHEIFNAEYALMPSDTKLTRHFGFHRTNSVEMPPFVPVYFGDYWVWQKDELAVKGGKYLLPRAGFEQWLYAHFLKIVLPSYRPYASGTSVVAPLHFMTFFRLAAHAHQIGYPAHWISAVLESLCSGRIKTTARAPRNMVMEPDIVNKAYPAREMEVSHWMAELTTILSVWRRLLPFGLLLSPTVDLPLHSTISEYSVKFSKYITTLSVHFPHFAIGFWDSAIGNPPKKDLREFLLDDETTTSSPDQKRALRGLGHVVNAFRYTTDEKTATFWLRDDVAMKMMEKGSEWKAQIWRTDTWQGQSDIVDVTSAMKKLRTWDD